MNNNKIRRVFFLLLCCVTSLSFGAPEQEVVIFRKTQSDAALKQENAWVLSRLASEKNVANKFSLKAQVSLSTQMATEVSEKETFELTPATAGSGWSLGKEWLIGQHEAKPFVMHWTAKPGEALDLNAWDELWYEYRATSPAPVCTPEIILTAESRLDKDKMAKPVMTFANAAANPTFSNVVGPSSLRYPQILPLGERRIVEKDYFYLASRMARLEPDDVWRWGNEQKGVVVQRRMHLDLKNSGALEIALRPGAQVHRVNLLVSGEDNQSPGELIEFPKPQMQLDKISGLPMLRLNIREALEQRFPDRFPPNDKEAAALKNWFVQEVFLFINNPPARGFTKSPVESLRTLHVPDLVKLGKVDEREKKVLLPSRTDNLGAGRGRLVIDLSGLRKFQSLNLDSIEVRHVVSTGVEGCAISPGGLYRVAIGQASIPNHVLHVAQEWTNRLGGPYLFPEREAGKFESVEVQAYLPFSSRMPSLYGADENTGQGTELVPREKIDVADAVQETPAHLLPGAGGGGYDVVNGLDWVSQAGEGLDAPAGSRFSQELDALLMEGRDSQISVRLPVKARLKENSHLFVSLPKGADQVGYIVAEFELANGKTVLRSLLPNTALKLGLGENEVRLMKLTFHLTKSPFSIKLRDVAIFLPKIMDERTALENRYPMLMNLLPKPSDIIGAVVTDMAEGRLSALMLPEGGDKARFRTTLGSPLEGAKGIRLAFAIPSEWIGPACPLSMELVGERASLAHTLCFDKAEGEIYLPIVQWLAAAKGGTDIGSLREIRWEVRRPGDKAGAFSFNWNIEGWRMVNLEDAILLKIGRKIFGMGRLTERESIFDGRRKFWLPLESEALGELLKNLDYAEWTQNKVLQVEQVVIAPKTPMAWDKWLQLNAAPPSLDEPHIGRWMKLGFMALSIGVLVWLGSKGILITLWRILGGLARAGVSKLRTVCNWILWVGRLINKAVVILVMVMLLPGAYWAGTCGFTLEAFFIGYAMSILGLGALLHARPLPKWATGMENTLERMQPGLRFAVFVAILLAIWAVGALKSVSGAAFAFLPLAAAAYWRLPYWGYFIRRHPLGSKFLFFAAVTIVLYAVGLRIKVDGGENYFFTFGGVAAVIALRFALLSLQPVMTRRWPFASEHVYRGGGALYFSGALAMLTVTVLLLILKLEPLAEQTAIVVYYCLVVGTAIEIAVQRREQSLDVSAKDTDPQSLP